MSVIHAIAARMHAIPAAWVCAAGSLARLVRRQPYGNGDLIRVRLSDDVKGIEDIEKDVEVHSRNQVPRSSSDPMTSKFLRLLLAVAALFAISALAQTSSAATPSASSAAPANPPAAPSATTAVTGTKVGSINIEQAKGTLAHEMVHTFVGGLDGESEALAWFSEGLAVYYERVLPLRAGLITADAFLRDLNTTAGRYYTDLLNQTPNDEIDKHF